MKLLSILLACILLLSPFNALGEDGEIEALLGSLTVREKVGQLFCVRPDAIMLSGSKILGEGSKENLKNYPVGGFIFFSQNISGPDQVEKLMADLSAVTRIPPYFAVDEEGGNVARFANSSAYTIPNVGNMAKIGSSGDTQNAYDAAFTIGSYLKELGFHLNFAPVADVKTNPENTAIGNRAFSSDPLLAAEMVHAAVQGFDASGVACTLKHFPGHGDTFGDSHNGSVTVYKTWDEMLECEMLPFMAGFDAGAEAVMLAHILTPNAVSDGMPASLSPEMVTGHLREELGFDGLIITDSLSMGAITQHFDCDVAAMAALYAGADILLMPSNLKKAFDTMVWAAEENILPMERLDESVRRILEFKRDCGIL